MNKLSNDFCQSAYSIPGIIKSPHRSQHANRHRPNPAGWHSFPVHRGEPVGYPATAGARRLVLYWEPAPSIPGIFRSTNEYRHDILQQPEPAGGYNRTTNNCECIDCSILVFLDCFLSVIQCSNIKLTRVLWRQENGTYSIPGIFRPPDGNRHGRYPAFPGQQFGTGIIRGIAQSHPVSIIGPVITGNAFFPIWYHIRRFAGPRELGWSDTLYSFLESDGPVQCNAPTWKLHRTVFGNDIIIEGYGDVHIRTFAGTKSIL